MAYEELCRRYVSGVCATLLVEAIGHGTASTEELEDEVIMNKRQIIFQRCVDTDHSVPTGLVFHSCVLWVRKYEFPSSAQSIAEQCKAGKTYGSVGMFGTARIADALNRLPEPSLLMSKGGGRASGAANATAAP